MSSARNLEGGRAQANDRAAIAAMKLLARWRRQGFDAITCHPTGYCSPANSTVSVAELPDGYCRWEIDSDEALSAVARSIRAGMAYRI